MFFLESQVPYGENDGQHYNSTGKTDESYVAYNYENKAIELDNTQDPNDLCLYMSGVPYSARVNEIKQFFGAISKSLVEICVIRDAQTYKPTGECCCKFTSGYDRDEALKEKNEQLLRNRVVKVRRLTYQEYEAIAGPSKFVNRDCAMQMGRPALLQTPLNVDDRPMLNNENGSNNNNNVQYDNPNNSQQPMDTNDQFNDTKNDQQPYDHGRRYGNNDYQQMNRNRYQPNQQRGGYVNRNNFDRDNRNANPPFKRRANDQQFTQRGNNSYDNTSYDNNQDPNNMQTKRIRKYDNDQYQSMPATISLPPELESYKSLVLLSNLAHKASRDDILDLIQPFNPIDDTLKIRHTDYGKPTGDAIVAFQTTNDAFNACKQLNGSMFIGRRLKVVVHK